MSGWVIGFYYKLK